MTLLDPAGATPPPSPPPSERVSDTAATGLEASPAPAPAPASASRLSRVPERTGAVIAIVIFALTVLGPFVADVTANGASRSALTAAIVEHHSVEVSPYAGVLGVDKAIVDGGLRSDKAPGQPVLAVPFYAFERAIGADSYAHQRVTGNLTVWWLTFTTSLVPFALLLGLVWCWLAEHDPRRAWTATLALGAGTLLLVFSPQLYGHSLTALCAFAAWMCVRTRPIAARGAAAAGLLAGASVVVEYQSAIAAVAILAWVYTRERRRTTPFIAGAALPAMLLAGYQWLAFGAPWRLPYSYFAPDLARLGAKSGGITAFGVHSVSEVLVGAHGLVTVTPLVAVALWAMVGPQRRVAATLQTEARFGVAVALGFVMLAAMWSGSLDLEVPGPRYIVPGLAFLGGAVLIALQRARRVVIGASIFGAVTMALGVLTPHLVSVGRLPLDEYIRQLHDHAIVPTLWTMAFGSPVGWVIHATTIAAAAWWLRRALARFVGAAIPIAS